MAEAASPVARGHRLYSGWILPTPPSSSDMFWRPGAWRSPRGWFTTAVVQLEAGHLRPGLGDGA